MNVSLVQYRAGRLFPSLVLIVVIAAQWAVLKKTVSSNLGFMRKSIVKVIFMVLYIRGVFCESGTKECPRYLSFLQGEKGLIWSEKE